MPDPKRGETRQEFMKHCIPKVLADGAAQDQEQAAAICFSMWRKKKAKEVPIDWMGLLGKNP